MNLKNLSDEALLSKTKELVSEERKITTQVLHHLREVERRKLFLARGFPSLFEYAVRELGYSESSAQRRISSMRLMQELPEIEEKIQNGSLSLTVISQAQTFFKQEGTVNKLEILKTLEHTSSREAERILNSHSTNPPPREIKIQISDELLGALEKLKGLLAHKHPNASTSELIEIAVNMANEKLDPAKKCQKALPAPAVKRAIPSALKTFIWKRDEGKCTYQDSKTGRRCNSIHALQMDHITPYAIGGSTSAENLRLLCAKHNRFEAAKFFSGLRSKAG